MSATTTPDRAHPDTGARAAPPAWAPVAATTLKAVLRRYQQQGGLAGGDEVSSRLRGVVEQPISTLARWIVAREVVVLPCESVLLLLLPLFQFDFRAGRVLPAVSAALSELRPVFDDWDLASWFATPNVLLDAAAPMQCLLHDPAAVVEAARTDRFIAAG
ncbi:hypothetical protein ACPOLB_25230 [Rubrivivax sp. RP6-9]|uniref:hypothetical protein n=1 Tax=Rubrivivax sp. RP6-9 TaxID=3415750 RepID=UPI003CC685BD